MFMFLMCYVFVSGLSAVSGGEKHGRQHDPGVRHRTARRRLRRITPDDLTKHPLADQAMIIGATNPDRRSRVHNRFKIEQIAALMPGTCALCIIFIGFICLYFNYQIKQTN